MPDGLTSATRRARVAVAISGRGSNMAALVYASRLPDCPFEIVRVVADNPDAAGLALSRAEGIDTVALAPPKKGERAIFEAALTEALSDADVIALAGFMRVLSADFVARHAGRIVNIHPSLLPAHKGLHTHAAVLAAGETHSGATVHVVTADLDSGEIIGQVRVAVLPADTAETLAARVQIAEHQLYPRALADFVTRDATPAFLVACVRERALALPDADEVLSHGMACFGITKGKKFAYVSVDHHGDGKTALLVKVSGIDEQALLIEQEPDRYYRPAYFGDGWVGIRLDLGDTDWEHVADWLARSWRAVAPRRLATMLDL